MIYDQHGLGSKPTRVILLCPWERHFTALQRMQPQSQKNFHYKNLLLLLRREFPSASNKDKANKIQGCTKLLSNGFPLKDINTDIQSEFLFNSEGTERRSFNCKKNFKCYKAGRIIGALFEMTVVTVY